MPRQGACGDARRLGRGREVGTDQGLTEVSAEREWTRWGGQAEDWLVWIIPAGSGHRACPGLSGTDSLW